MKQKIANDILIDYDLLFDEDYGIRQIILDKYRNNDCFKIEMLSNTDRITLNGILASREDKNPLSIMLKTEYMDSKDSLYEEFKKYLDDEIIKLSPKTDLVSTLKMLNLTGEVNINVLCKKISQKQNIKEKITNMDYNIILYEDEKIDIKNYDSLYIKFYDVLDMITFPKAKNIYVADYRFNSLEYLLSDPENYDEKLLLNLYLLFRVNKFSMIDLYNYKHISKPVG